MREILFRGKRKNNGEWVYGFLLKECNYVTCSWNLAIEYKTDRFGKFAYDVAEIATETVGQFTGVTDKNGQRIFEGDIIKYITPENLCAVGEVKFGEHGAGGTISIGFFAEWHRPEGVGWLRQDIGFWSKEREIKIIGNIHDNPELLEVTDNA